MPGVLPYPYNGQNNIINFVGARGKLSFIELHTIIFPISWAHRKGNKYYGSVSDLPTWSCSFVQNSKIVSDPGPGRSVYITCWCIY